MAKRRTRSPHPGVVLCKPAFGRASWRAKYRNPDTDQWVFERIEPADAKNAEGRKAWAVLKSGALAERRSELTHGAPRQNGMTIEEGVNRFFDDRTELRAATVRVYKIDVSKFTQWCAANRVHVLDDITRPALLSFRAAIIAQGNDQPSRATKLVRGNRAITAHTINRELRSVRVVLGYLADLDLLSKASLDDLRRGLKRIKQPIKKKAILKGEELTRLLSAAIEHDRVIHALTRQEKANGLKVGTTPAHPMIGPYLLATLLMGTRASEGMDLEWSHLDLSARDHSGKVTGEITLPSATKTHRERTIGLRESPSLLTLFTSLAESRGEDPRVFHWLTMDTAEAARKRLQKSFGAPKYSWQKLRATCGSFLTNSPGIYQAASIWHSAERLGHSETTARAYYLDSIRGIPPEADTLEKSMGIEALADAIVEMVRQRQPVQAAAAE